MFEKLKGLSENRCSERSDGVGRFVDILDAVFDALDEIGFSSKYSSDARGDARNF